MIVYAAIGALDEGLQYMKEVRVNILYFQLYKRLYGLFA
jgi:hypothetical protein